VRRFFSTFCSNRRHFMFACFCLRCDGARLTRASPSTCVPRMPCLCAWRLLHMDAGELPSRSLVHLFCLNSLLRTAYMLRL